MCSQALCAYQGVYGVISESLSYEEYITGGTKLSESFSYH